MLKQKDLWRLGFHLMPPEGWLNDPNGLCQFQGQYHVFFQYSPKEAGPDGRPARTWGHYAGSSLMDLKFQGVPFWPTDAEDHDGCYSGSAVSDGEKIRLYYTGNVKQSGNHDYTYSGREANEILVETDGQSFGEKRTVLRNRDYPEDCTCHVRDPKVWKENGTWYMVLGARVKSPEKTAETDRGEILFYESGDGISWKLLKTLSSPERFGYMWECPDYFELGGKTFLSLCPQGVPAEEFRYQNIYQAGYYTVKGELRGKQTLHNFREWDYGFDFYAPQTFTDENGRRILFGWIGMPDHPYGNPTDQRGWENCLTVPRLLTVEDGVICQNPVPELAKLRYHETMIMPRETFCLPDGTGDFEICFLEGTEDQEWKIAFGDAAELSFRDGVLQLSVSDNAGYGRTVRKVRTERIEFLRILVDTSVLEIYADDGKIVLTTRYYPDYQGERQDLEVHFHCPSAAITGWRIHPHCFF